MGLALSMSELRLLGRILTRTATAHHTRHLVARCLLLCELLRLLLLHLAGWGSVPLEVRCWSTATTHRVDKISQRRAWHSTGTHIHVAARLLQAGDLGR
jgi:hypothetical protein